jgi:recombination protein RecT
MYRGLLNRFERSGQYKWIGAGLRRTDDIAWRMWTDEHGPHFLHEPGPGDGTIVESYAAATTLNGGFFISVVTEKEMARIRAVSRAKSDESPWQKWEDEMRKKTALRRLSKTLPMPQGIEELMSRSEDDDNGGDIDESESTPTTPPPRPRGAHAALEQFAQGEAQQKDLLPPNDKPAAVVEEAGGAQAASGAVSETNARAPAATDAEVDQIKRAYVRGQQDRKAGRKADDMPEEYADNEHNKHQISWMCGFDGKPMPSWSK